MTPPSDSLGLEYLIRTSATTIARKLGTTDKKFVEILRKKRANPDWVGWAIRGSDHRKAKFLGTSVCTCDHIT